MQTLAPLTLGLAPWAIGLFVVVFVLVSVILMLTILIQKPQGGGLSGAFGAGAGSGQTAFGTKTGDALTIATISMFAVWVVGGVGLNFALTPSKTNAATTTVSDPAAPADGSGANAETPANSTNPPVPAPTTPGTETPAPVNPTPAPAEPTPANPTPAPENPAPAEKPADQPPQTPPGDKPADQPTGNPGGQP